MKLALLLSVMIVCHDVTVRSDEGDAKVLYDHIADGNYTAASDLTFKLKIQGDGDIIRDVVLHLFDNDRPEIFEYAYCIWSTVYQIQPYFSQVIDGKDVVKAYFPSDFAMLLNGDKVMMVDVKHFMAVKLGYIPNIYGDRKAYGSMEAYDSDRISWRFIPHWSGSHVYFKIYNTKHHKYLKMTSTKNDDGDHLTTGTGEQDTDSHMWYLLPSGKNTFLRYQIYNRYYNEPLKLHKYQDTDGDRSLVSHSNGTDGYVSWDSLVWIIRPVGSMVRFEH